MTPWSTGTVYGKEEPEDTKNRLKEGVDWSQVHVSFQAFSKDSQVVPSRVSQREENEKEEQESHLWSVYCTIAIVLGNGFRTKRFRNPGIAKTGLT